MEPITDVQINRWTTELIALRKGAGIGAERLLRAQPAVLNDLPALEGLTNTTDRAMLFIELVHTVLGARQEDREARSLAVSLNLDVAEPWSGQPKPISADQLLMARRRSFAELEHVSEDGGKPMSEWENAAARRLVEHLASLPAPATRHGAESAHTSPPSEPEPTEPPASLDTASVHRRSQ